MLGTDPEKADGAYRARIGIVLQSSAVYPTLSVREIVELFAGYYPAPREPDDVIELVGLGEQRDAARPDALGRPAAPPRPRARARRRPRADLPRRADHRLRPRRAPPGLGDDPRPARARQDDPPHHALPGGGADSSPTGSRSSATDGSSASARRASCSRATGWSRSATAATARRSCVATNEPTRVLNELTAEALARGEELEGLEVQRRSLEDVYLELTGDDRSSSASSRSSSGSSGAAARRRSSRSCCRSSSSSCSARSTATRRSTGSRPRRSCSPACSATASSRPRSPGSRSSLVIRRESGVLKRVRGTPLPTRDLPRRGDRLDARRARDRRRSRSSSSAATSSTRAGPQRSLALALSCCSSARPSSPRSGSRSPALVRSAEGSSAVVNAIYLPMVFISGVFFSRRRAARRSSRRSPTVSPLTYLLELVRDLYIDGGTIGTPPPTSPCWSRGAWPGSSCALRMFRWEPREG